MSRPCENCGCDIRICRDCDLYKSQYIKIPKDATNGDVIKALYPNNTIKLHSTPIGVMGIDVRIYTGYHSCFDLWFPISWWNAPYKEENNE